MTREHRSEHGITEGGKDDPGCGSQAGIASVQPGLGPSALYSE